MRTFSTEEVMRALNRLMTAIENWPRERDRELSYAYQMASNAYRKLSLGDLDELTVSEVAAISDALTLVEFEQLARQ